MTQLNLFSNAGRGTVSSLIITCNKINFSLKNCADDQWICVLRLLLMASLRNQISSCVGHNHQGLVDISEHSQFHRVLQST